MKQPKNIGKIVLIASCVLLLLGLGSPVAAQENAPVPVAFTESDAGLVFYGLTADNTLEPIGNTPKISTTDWNMRDWLGRNAVLSPDGYYVAFTATSKTSDHISKTGLFLYTIESNNLKQAFVADFTPYAIQLQWSPDNQSVLIQPITCDCGGYRDPSPETYVYEVASNQWLALTNTPQNIEDEFVWTADSTHLIYQNYSGVINIVDRQGNGRSVFADMGKDASTNLFVSACHFVWSPSDMRWYYAIGCSFDDSENDVYSVDLQGNSRLEADLHTLYHQEFDSPEPDLRSPINDIHVVSMQPFPQGVYAVINIGVVDGQTIAPYWRVIRIDRPEHIETVVDLRVNAHQMTKAVFSPGLAHVALASDNYVIVANLPTGKQISVVNRPIETNNVSSPYIRWIDDNRLLYGADNDVWLLETSDGTTTNLTTDIEAMAFLLPQTNSY